MPIIGEFEVAVQEADPTREPDQFKLQGETFTVSERDLTIVFGTFARAATSGLDTAEMEGMAAMVDMLEGVVIDEDKQRLIGLSKRVGLDGDLLMEIVKTVMESRTGRPTEQPSDSSDGLQTTGESSRALSPFGKAVPPIQMDPRIQALRPVDEAGLSLVV